MSAASQPPAARAGASQVSVVVVTRDRAAQTTRCVDSLLASDVPIELIVVDNASADDTTARLREAFGERIVQLQSPTNRGAAGGRNLGAEAARGERVVFVDSDNVVAPELVGRLAALLESEPRIGLAGPLMAYHCNPESVWCAGADINLWSGRTRYRHAGERVADVVAGCEAPFEVGHIPNIFACRLAEFRRVGGFHEPYHILFEESDLAERLRRLGLVAVIDPLARAWHDVPPPSGGSLRAYGIQSAERCELMARNRLLFLRRNAGRTRLAVFLAVFMAPLTVYYLRLMLRQGRRDFARAYLRGLWGGLRPAAASRPEGS